MKIKIMYGKELSSFIIPDDVSDKWSNEHVVQIHVIVWQNVSEITGHSKAALSGSRATLEIKLVDAGQYQYQLDLFYEIF